MFYIIVIALFIYTCMIFSINMRTYLGVIGTLFMLLYGGLKYVYPSDKLFEILPLEVVILVLAPCSIFCFLCWLLDNIAHKPKPPLPPPPPPQDGRYLRHSRPVPPRMPRSIFTLKHRRKK